ncbi:hypothetical protein ACFQ9H_12145 [Streptomyces sp. NPDC056517]|uniref:hypothetical protein n=1 Tax=unclassified Streptomyces TaxID=2593676 RepID=UPI0036B633D0
MSESVPIAYRDAEWFDQSGVRETGARIDELNHLVSDGLLKARLQLVVSLIRSMADATTTSYDSPERRITVVARQSSTAGDLHEHAKAALVDLRRRL